MALTSLDHYNLETSELEKTIQFYESALGMTQGERPPFEDGTEGAWLCINGHAVVHVNRIEESKAGRTGAIGHQVFDADDFDGTVTHLQNLKVDFDAVDSRPAIPLRQLYLTDPNQVLIELNFRGE